MNLFRSNFWWVLGVVLLTLQTGAQELTKVVSDSVVTLEYVVKLSDQTVVGGTEDGKPVTFRLGEGNMFPAVEDKLVGLEAGQTQEIVLTPEQAFGQVNPEALHQLENSEIPDEYREVGRAITVQDSQGTQHQGLVVEVNDELTTIDFNHPLAGRTLHVVVKLLKIEE